MFSTAQVDLLAEIVTQYDYYVAYYYGTFYDYTAGENRDNLIQVYCSDQQPVIENGTYKFTDCCYYEITHNKYMMLQEAETLDFTPISEEDIVYTNAAVGYPQLCYSISAIRTEAPEFIMYAILVVAAIAILIRLIFGR